MTTAKKRPSPPASAKGRSATGPAAKSTAGSTPQGRAAASRRGPQAPPKKSFPVLPVVFGVVALALIAAIMFSSSRSINDDETGEPTITGEVLAPFATGTEPASDEAVGTTPPTLSGEDFDGNSVVIDPADGTPKAVVFLAHWCPHCQAEVPRVQAWLDAGGGVEGVELMSVSTSMNSSRTNYPPSEWLEGEGWTAPVLRDSAASDAYIAYGGGAFPYYVFIDADGNVVRRSSGELDVATLETYMQEIAP
ncbi:MAG: TlpA disulfide reductase family protein [Acidimicrobiia bacterium]